MKARVRFVLDELINTRDLDSVFQIPDQQRRCEQDLIAALTTNEHPSRPRHAVVLIGEPTYQGSDVVVVQSDVFEHGEMSAPFFRYVNV